jgi:S-adenosylmethionine:tRNA ribosyltransferase-isomerase
MRTADFDFHLPESLIAQRPAPTRDSSRLLVLDRASGKVIHCANINGIIGFLRPGDLIVFNDSKVFPARLRGQKAGSGGQIEVLLLEEVSTNVWWTMLRPGKRVRAGTRILFGSSHESATAAAIVLEKNAEGHCRLQFSGTRNITTLLDDIGEVPLPPYIVRPPEAQDAERYQTIFARDPGSVAAPTAGLHFTEDLLRELRARDVQIEFITLHVGLGTFAPVKAAHLTQHTMHEERFEVDAGTAARINAARQQGRRVVAVGTTSVRVLESVAAEHGGRLAGVAGRTRIFIHPPFTFHVVGALLTNFHLPRSTLLMLASAFAAPGETRGMDLVLAAYEEAVRQEYRFFSYGDAMLIV